MNANIPIVRRTWTDEELVEAVKQSTNMAGVLRALGLTGAGANYASVAKYIKLLNLDNTHWGQSKFLKGPSKFRDLKDYTFEYIFCDESKAGRKSVINYVLKYKLMDYSCAICSNAGMHEGLPLILQLDHTNGKSQDHRLENIRWLCPNCHSQTPTFAGRNIRKKPLDNTKTDFNKSTMVNKPVSRKTKIDWPDSETLQNMVLEKPLKDVAKILGVSDKAVKKRCIKLNLVTRPTGYFLRKI